ncbi:MAG: hypothetical protein LAQ30_16760 [Acidobacteriia bacterium]|nr:hypothetical protein [Terriglobia bacterium]
MALAISEPEISLGDFLRTLARRKLMIGLSTAAVMALTGVAVFFIPVRYAAEAVILPPQPEPSTQGMMMGAASSALGLGLLANTGASALFRNPGDLYVGLLKSRTVADALIARFGLRRLYDEKTMVDTRKRLASRTAIAIAKDLLIHIRVEDRDRARAAEMANAYVDELHRRNSRLALTSAAQRRLFFEEQLRSEKEALANAETAFQGEEQSSGLIYPSGQSAALLRAVAELRAEIASREVEAQSVRLYAGPENQEIRQIEESIAGLRAQLQKLEGSGGSDNGGLLVPAGKIPQAGLDYLRKMRDVKYHETLFELLSKQYEAARIDEARESPLVQVVDRAEPPDKKCWPPRALLIGIAGALAFLVSCWIAARRGRLEEVGYDRL